MEQGEANAEVEGCYLLTGPPPFSVQKEKLDFSQTEQLLCEILYLREPRVGCLTFFNLGTEKEGGLIKTKLAVHYS